MTTQNQSGFYYIVLPGDSLYKISQKFNVPLKELIAANNISAPYIIYPGQKIFVPRTTPPQPPPGGKVYIVKKGETLSSIAKSFNVSVDSIVSSIIYLILSYLSWTKALNSIPFIF